MNLVLYENTSDVDDRYYYCHGWRCGSYSFTYEFLNAVQIPIIDLGSIPIQGLWAI